MTVSFTVRTARVEDATAIGILHVRAWQVGYRGMMPEEFLDGLDVDAWVERRRGHLQKDPSNTLVIEADGAVVGFSSLLRSRDEDARPGIGEIAAVYVHPDFWRSGCGRAMMEREFERARAAGFETLTLWVLATNERARAYYESLGFELDGARKEDDRFGDFVLDEVRYRIAL